MKVKRKYILKYTKRKLIHIFILTIIILILFFMEIFIRNNSFKFYIKKDLLKIIILSIPIIITFLVYILKIIRFNKLIKKQEKKYNIKFNDNNAIILSKKYLNYLSSEWYIHSGNIAFYYKHIETITLKEINLFHITKKRKYLMTIKTINNKKYHILIERPLHYEQIQKWHRSLIG